jgi:hypothetical protein
MEVTEAVPFRLTPNLQHFITPVGIEGVFAASLMAMGRCLADPEVRACSCCCRCDAHAHAYNDLVGVRAGRCS